MMLFSLVCFPTRLFNIPSFKLNLSIYEVIVNILIELIGLDALLLEFIIGIDFLIIGFAHSLFFPLHLTPLTNDQSILPVSSFHSQIIVSKRIFVFVEHHIYL
jgi:hypothetical protein